ncbi:hypothetical protein ACP4OV_017076 [Aristida adscensionis]
MAGAVEANARPPPATLDPQLFMAARRGDRNRLRELLRPSGDGDHHQAAGTAAAASATTTPQAVVAVQVDPPAAAAAAPTSTKVRVDGVTRNEGNSLLHVVAAAGDGDDFLRCAEMISGYSNGRLLAARNHGGDTPLHRAAAAGNVSMVTCLVGLMAAAEAAGGETPAKAFVGMRNNHGETALHQAVRAGSKAAMDKLMSVDSELACVPQEGDQGGTTSPLYLAISLGKEDIARHLIHTSNGKLSCSGPDGRNVLHAAVYRGQALPMLLEVLKDVIVVGMQQGDRHASNISQLAARQDKDGSTPFHLVASLEGWPDVKRLSQRLPKVWSQPKSTTTLLLEANICSAYQPDNQGLYPIHVAAMNGSLTVIRTLLKMCPDCATLRDEKGRSFVHAAAEWEGRDLYSRNKVVEYVCRQPQLSCVLNMQDNNGDTALHRAVHAGNMEMVYCLIRNRQVDLSIPNKDDLTPLDLSWSKIPTGFNYTWNPRCMIQASLVLVGAPCGGSRVDDSTKVDEDKESQDLTNATQVMGIVSVLVATVTFASAFTLPGGSYQSAGDGGVPGTPILSGSYGFQAFIFADVLAFICSSLATFSLVFSGVPAMERSIRYKYVNISAILLHISGSSLVAAFALGLYMVLAPVAHTTAIIVVSLISSAALLFVSMEFWPWIRAVSTVNARHVHGIISKLLVLDTNL